MNILLYDIPDNKAFTEELTSLYERADVKEGITSNTGYVLPPSWYLQDDYHHCIFLLDEKPIGSIFYELNSETTATVHLNFLREYSKPKITTKAGELFLQYVYKKHVLLQKLRGEIPDVNRVAQLYARRMGFNKVSEYWTPTAGHISVFDDTPLGEE